MTYQVTSMRTGVGQHSAVADASSTIADGLNGHAVAAAMFGSVPAAERFHAVLVHVWARQAIDADTEAARRRDVAARSGEAARLGTGLVTDTTTLARSAAGPLSV